MTDFEWPPDEIAGPPTESSVGILISRMARAAKSARSLWLPLPKQSSTLEAVLGSLIIDPRRGLTTEDTWWHNKLRTPVASVDKPAGHRREVSWTGFEAGSGHLAIVGSTGSGKSTLLATIVSGLALTHTPSEIQFYCLDFAGGALSELTRLPHIGGLATADEAASARLTLQELARLLTVRQNRFAKVGAKTMEAYLTAVAAGAVDDAYGHVFLVVDGWARLFSAHHELERPLTRLVEEGRALGIHVIAASDRWSDFVYSVGNRFATMLELRLDDPHESRHDSKAAANLPQAPGHGLNVDGSPMRVLLADATAGTHTTGALPPGAEPLATRIAQAWAGDPAPPMPNVPARVEHTDLSSDDVDPLKVPIGLTRDRGIVVLDFRTEPHLLISGEHGCGKTTLLRSMATTIADRFGPDGVHIMRIDSRSGQQAVQRITALARTLDKRQPPSEITTRQQLRERRWLAGQPEHFLFLDDFDLSSPEGQQAIEPLLAFLDIADYVGLHVVIAHRPDDQTTMPTEMMLDRLRWMATPTLRMSGDSQTLPPGRGEIIARGSQPIPVQCALPPHPADTDVR